MPEDAKQELMVALAGQAVNVALAIVLAAMLVPVASRTAPKNIQLAGAGIVYFAHLDWLKVWLFGRLNLR